MRRIVERIRDIALALIRTVLSPHVMALVALDLMVIVLAVASAQQLGYWNPDGALWLKAASVATVTLLVLYLADLYKLDFRIRWVELASRLVVALAAITTATAAIGFALPVLRLGRLAFLHILGVIALGLLTSRFTWIAHSPKRRR